MKNSFFKYLSSPFLLYLSFTPVGLYLLSAVLGSSAKAQVLADYGDAPDGVGGKNYPSLFGSPNAASGLNAPFHLDTSREWLGLTGPPSTTTVENDSLQVDMDFDDTVL